MVKYMFKFFKNLLATRTPSSSETPEEELLTKILEMVHYENLNALFYTPVNKLYLLNTYSDDFNDLASNFYNLKFSRQINAINIHAYLLCSKVDLKGDLERIAKSLRTNKPNMLIQHDLYELYNTFVYLKSMES